MNDYWEIHLRTHLDSFDTEALLMSHLQVGHGRAGGPSDLDGLRRMHAADHSVVTASDQPGTLAEQAARRLLSTPPLGTVIHAQRNEDPEEPTTTWCGFGAEQAVTNLIADVTCEACKEALANAPSTFGVQFGEVVDFSGFDDGTVLHGARGLGLKALFPGGDHNEIATQFAEVAWRRGLISTNERDWLVNTKPKVEASIKDVWAQGHHAPGLVTAEEYATAGDYQMFEETFEGVINIGMAGIDERLKLHALLDAMVTRKPVRIVVDLTNGIGEVTEPAGWTTTITEIRRPALPQNLAAYGHLDPVIKVDGAPTGTRGLTIALRPSQVEIIDG